MKNIYKRHFFILIIVFTALFAFHPSYAEDKSLPSQTDLPGKASLWEYDSLCEFKDSKNIPESKTYLKGSYSSEGCQGLEKRYGKPTAVIISVLNINTKPLAVTLPKLSNITLHTNNGIVLPAIAYRDASNFGMGLTYTFMTTMTNSIKMEIKPGKALDLIFLFSSASPGDKLILGEYSPLTIEK